LRYHRGLSFFDDNNYLLRASSKEPDVIDLNTMIKKYISYITKQTLAERVQVFTVWPVKEESAEKSREKMYI